MMKYFALIILLTITHFGYSQNYVMTASSRRGVISLRWAPTNYDAWRLGNTYGYMVERVTILRDSLFTDSLESIKLTHQPLRVASLEDWEANVDNDDMVALAAQCIFDTLEVAKTPFEIYQQHNTKHQYFSFALYAADMSSFVADLSALSFKDQRADKREKYLYRVYAATPDSLASDTASVFITSAVDTELPIIGKPEIHSNDGAIVVQWDTRYLSRHYVRYVVERSTDGIHFSVINDKPSIQFSNEDVDSRYMFYTDSISDNTTLYHYRVIGVTCFGEESVPSEVVAGHGMKALTKSPEIINKRVVDNSRVELEWYIDEESAEAVEGFRIYRRSGPKERFKMIKDFKDNTKRTYIDNLPDITNYYKISAYNSAVELTTPYESYVELVDSIPPAVPVGLTGTIDSTGVVSVRWSRNHEKDLQGYRVYSSNSPVGEFSLQTSYVLRDTLFEQTIPLNTLAHTIYYHVRSVDVRGNTSQPSEVLVLERPDTIPPIAPKLMKPDGQAGRAHIQWMKSFDSDVVVYFVMRRNERELKQIVSVQSTGAEVYDYYDETAQYGVSYDYLVVAQDKSGNLSKSDNWRRLHMDAPEVKAPKIKLKEAMASNMLTIEMPKDIVGKTPTHLLIYRVEGEGVLKAYDRVSVSDTYLDKNVRLDIKYGYAVRILFSDMSESGISDIVKQK
ncbi:MAG: hypothetical protein HUJ96_07590 [Marinilabiliaceae bacterium]|nr:hypothetical protein [Marinilabiliaceae bacterium]